MRHVAALQAKGLSRADAIRRAIEEKPAAHARYLAIANPHLTASDFTR